MNLRNSLETLFSPTLSPIYIHNSNIHVLCTLQDSFLSHNCTGYVRLRGLIQYFTWLRCMKSKSFYIIVNEDTKLRDVRIQFSSTLLPTFRRKGGYCFTIGVRSWAWKWTFWTFWSTLNTKIAFSEFHIYICTDFVIRTSLSIFDRLS